jgi:hypothetical protein
MQAALTGRGREYILLAVVKERTDRQVVEYLCQKLPVEISKAFQCRRSLTTSHSPLYNALLKICSSYKAVSAYSESIFAYTETTAVLIDVKAGTLARVHYGSKALAALVLDPLGQPCQPTSSQKHYMDNTFIHEDRFSNIQGQHSVVIGSPGLWYFSTVRIVLCLLKYDGLACHLCHPRPSLSPILVRVLQLHGAHDEAQCLPFYADDF